MSHLPVKWDQGKISKHCVSSFIHLSLRLESWWNRIMVLSPYVLQRLEERKATMVIGKRKMVNSPPEMISLVSCCQLQMSEIISSKICDLYLIIKKKKKQKVIAKNLVFVSYFKKRPKIQNILKWTFLLHFMALTMP